MLHAFPFAQHFLNIKQAHYVNTQKIGKTALHLNDLFGVQRAA
jgi:hypothetical protein